MFSSNKNTSVNYGGIFAFLKQNFITLILGAILLVYAIPFIKRRLDIEKGKKLESDLTNNQESSSFENSLANPALIVKKVKEVKKKYPFISNDLMNKINTNALGIAVALGTSAKRDGVMGYLTSLTEDEKEAVRLVKQHSGTFPVLAELYYTVHTKSRSLKDDLLNYLSKSDLNEIRASHLKHGNFKHI